MHSLLPQLSLGSYLIHASCSSAGHTVPDRSVCVCIHFMNDSLLIQLTQCVYNVCMAMLYEVMTTKVGEKREKLENRNHLKIGSHSHIVAV